MVCFGIGGISDKDTGYRLLKEFWLVCGDEGECPAANFAEVRERWRLSMPSFIWSSPIERDGGCKGGEVGSSCTEFIPEEGRGIAHKTHALSFVHNCPMYPLCMSILCQGVRCC